MVNKQNYLQPFLQSKFTFLLITLLFYILIAPYLLQTPSLHYFFNFLIFIIFIAVIIAAKPGKIMLSYFIITMLLDFFSSTLDLSITVQAAPYIEHISFFLFCLGAIVIFGHDILKQQAVKQDTLLGAICVYILIAFAFSAIYALIELMFPGSFINTVQGVPSHLTRFDFFYFSFITLTTVGYGDIGVVTSYARSIVILESIMGIFYLAILVSRLVAKRK